MTNPHDTYTSPLAARNASPEMCKIWSPRHKFTTWRKIWLAVAEAQQACGLNITDEQLDEMRSTLEVTDEDMESAAKYERELRHDVMAHVHAWGDRCPKARPIIHLGCTSQDVVCNADLMVQYEAVQLIESKISRAVASLGRSAESTKSIPTLGFTHYQPAQPVTVGRRTAGWANELYQNSPSNRDEFLGSLYRLRGFGGATGTQASFLNLFENDTDRVDRFEMLAVSKLLIQMGVIEDQGVAETLGLKVRDAWMFQLMGQTYPRSQDAAMLASLANIASVLHKIATDIRLLSNRKEIDEPFGKSQIGSSAMPYKRNPMKCERICGLTRFVMNLVGNAYDTAATQWLERTLDDSSNRRLSLPEAFLALDGALDLMHTVASGLIVNEAMVKRNLMAELPFMATENIMMEAVKLGRDRQDVHEAIRVLSHEAGYAVKQEGKDNDLLERLKSEPLLEGVDIDAHLDPMAYVGRSVEQTERFIREVVEPLRVRYADQLESLGSADRGV
ncbi:MAG: adenylosuccinate lyase [Phycisphaerales bacterium]|nr:adenylosuccinate lyase [Phycisphaerales bacterium]